MEPLRVVLLTDAAEHASADLRGFAPLKALEEARLAYVGIHHLGEVYSDEKKDMDETDPNSPIRKFARDVAMAEVIVIPMTASLGWNKFFDEWNRMGKVVVMDIDDDVRYVSPLSPSYRIRGTREVTARATINGKLVKTALWKDGKDGFDLKGNIERMEAYHAGLRAADAVTCPTPRFAETVRRELNPVSYCLPNCIDIDLWRPGRHPGRSKDEFRILWQGGDAHRMDVGACAEGLGAFLKEHPDAVFVICGADLSEFKAEVPPQQFEYWDWAHYDAHPWRIMGLGVDVGLCPVIDHKFNDAKSPLKWEEYGACGIPAICSNVPPYSDAVRDGEDGILVPNEPSEWLKALSRVYSDHALRRRIGDAARARVEADFDLYKNAVRWYEVYRELVDRKKALRGEAA